MAVMIATVEGLARVRSNEVRGILVGVLLVTSLGSSVAWGASPISHDYDRGIWPLHADARSAVKAEALSRLPSGAATSAVASSAAAARVRIWQSPEVATLRWTSPIRARFQN